MSKCEITFKNNVPVVKTYPKLMRELMVYTNNNISQALDLYGITLTDDFIDQNIYPTLENILAKSENALWSKSPVSISATNPNGYIATRTRTNTGEWG